MQNNFVALKCDDDEFVINVNLSILSRETLEHINTMTTQILQDRDMESEFKKTDFLQDGRPKVWNRQ